jgi:hypothetical protein
MPVISATLLIMIVWVRWEIGSHISIALARKLFNAKAGAVQERFNTLQC